MALDNPYKQRKNKWIRYATSGLCVIGVILVLLGRRSSPSSSSRLGLRGLESNKNGGGGQQNAHDHMSLEQMQRQHLDKVRAVQEEEEEEEEVGVGQGEEVDDNMEQQTDDATTARGDGDAETDDAQGGGDQPPTDDDGGGGMANKNNAAVLEEEGEDEDPEDKEEFMEDFPKIDLTQFPRWMKWYFEKLRWDDHSKQQDPKEAKKNLDRVIITDSLRLGCDNIATNQKEAGNFNYQYDFVEHEMDADDSQVRQAGALWGLTLCFQSHPENETYRKAVEKGLRFFTKRMEDGPITGSLVIHYEDDEESSTGTNALFGLSVVDYLRTIRDNQVKDADQVLVKDLETKYLVGVIQFLKYMQNEETKHFSQEYTIKDHTKSGRSSPYFDGEAMLCLIKAAKYMDGYNILIPRIVDTVPALCKAYTVDEWWKEHDSDKTKGFYQWSSMFMAEYYEARWRNYDLAADYVIALGHWIIHTHEILERPKNTGYAYEGIISAYAVAKNRLEESNGEDTRAQDAINDFSWTIDKGLYSLTSWQVGGPLAGKNKFLLNHPTNEEIAIGGVMNARNLAPLRIDTTQHQMHALMMALNTVYLDGDQPVPGEGDDEDGIDNSDNADAAETA